LREQIGVAARRVKPLCTIKHSITRYRMTVEASRVELGHGRARQSSGARWVARADLDRLAFTSAHRKILRAFLAQRAAAVSGS
jgi:adenine-specific DNA glycosylase